MAERGRAQRRSLVSEVLATSTADRQGDQDRRAIRELEIIGSN